MAAIGAAAGAFEAKKQEDERRLRSRGLDLQSAQMSEQGRQFNLKRQDEQQRTILDQSNKDREFGFRQQEADLNREERERTFIIGREDKQYDRDRQSNLDAWKKALDEQEMRRREFEIEKANEEYRIYQKARKRGEEERNNRTRLAESHLGMIARSAIENGVVSPEELTIFNQQIGAAMGQNIVGAYADGSGGVIMELEMSGEDGQPVRVARQISPQIMNAVNERMFGMGGQSGGRGQSSVFGLDDRIALKDREEELRRGRDERTRLAKVAQDQVKRYTEDLKELNKNIALHSTSKNKDVLERVREWEEKRDRLEKRIEQIEREGKPYVAGSTSETDGHDDIGGDGLPKGMKMVNGVPTIVPSDSELKRMKRRISKVRRESSVVARRRFPSDERAIRDYVEQQVMRQRDELIQEFLERASR